MRKTAVSTLLLALAATGCNETSLAYGDPNSIIAAMDPAVWAEVESDVYDALEPTIRTVRDEKSFTVTYQEPMAEYWTSLRRFRQMLVVGTGDEPWMSGTPCRARASTRPTTSGRGGSR